MKVVSKTPTRIDLAGGGLDIPPLYLLHEFGLTLNVAITVMAEVELETREGSQVTIHSEDLNKTISAKSSKHLETSELELLARMVRFFEPCKGFKITTRSASPAGAGLGGSSTLALALSAALNQVCRTRYDKETLINITKSLETQTINMPTGYQDYYSAAYGSFSAIWLQEPGVKRERVKVSPRFVKNFESSFLLVYVGKTRFSGTNNWQLVKDRIDGKAWAKNYLESTKQIALKMYQAMERDDFKTFVSLVEQDEKNRVKYFPKVETAEIRKLFRIAKKNGAWACRVCGAGGGGCSLILAPAAKLSFIQEEVIEAGGQILPCRVARKGLTITNKS